MSSSAAFEREPGGIVTFARNIGTRYLGLAVNVLIGLLVLPVNLAYLGTSAYGLWMLTASITTYFSVFDLGYGGAMVKFVAEYRAKNDARALNEILSTTYFIFCGVAIACYVAAIGVSFFLPQMFHLPPEQATASRIILLVVAGNVALQFPFSVFGGVVNGFQRYYLNNVIGTASNIGAALANVIVLWAGGGLIAVVVATTVVRVAPYWLYPRNARAIFPAMELKLKHFSTARLREITGFSVYMAVIDWAARLNYTVDAMVIGFFLNTAAVAIFSVGQRLGDSLLRLCFQLHTVLFPVVVHSEVTGDRAQQARVYVRANRFQLAVSIALCGAVIALADVLIPAWIRKPGFEQSALITQLLAYVVISRAWTAMPGTILKGTGKARFVAVATMVCAVANVLLSIPLVKSMGPVGAAVGTVIPVTLLNAFVFFPAGCHQAGLTTWQGYRRIVWPATWPAVVFAGFWAVRYMVTPRIVTVLGLMGMSTLLYIAVFFAAGLDREERQWFITKITELWQRRSQVVGVPLPTRRSAA